MFDPQHLDRVQVRTWCGPCFKSDRKAAELERTKLQSKIQKEKSELQSKETRKASEDGIGKAGSSKRPSRMKSPKKMKQEPDDDDDFLDDLVMDT